MSRSLFRVSFSVRTFTDFKFANYIFHPIEATVKEKQFLFCFVLFVCSFVCVFVCFYLFCFVCLTGEVGGGGGGGGVKTVSRTETKSG